MRLVTFRKTKGNDRGPCLGVIPDGRSEVVQISGRYLRAPSSMLALIAGGAEALRIVRMNTPHLPARYHLAEVELLAPIPVPPRNILCIGKNYREHVGEVRFIEPSAGDPKPAEVPEYPMVFTKATTAVIGPGVEIPSYLDDTDSTDYEGELGVVIGRGGRGIDVAEAMDHVFGYTIVNDVTARRLQKRHGQWFLGKSLDGYCPMGPAIVTADEIPDPTVLKVKTRVNGELRQDGCVADLIFDIPTLIATLSRGMTLQPGDIIATGTPAGVGMGFDPPRFLQPGDEVKITIEPIGTLRNPVACSPRIS